MNSGKPVWYQMVNGSLSNATDYLMPWYLNQAGGDFNEATQCMEAGDNGWDTNHDALNADKNNNWPLGNTPWYGALLVTITCLSDALTRERVGLSVTSRAKSCRTTSPSLRAGLLETCIK